MDKVKIGVFGGGRGISMVEFCTTYKEAELTAIRTIFAGRAAGLDGDTIRARLRETYV